MRRVLFALPLWSIAIFLAVFALGASQTPRNEHLPATAATTSTTASVNWSIVPSPNTTEQALMSVSCVSGSDCWSVGDYANSNNLQRTMIEHWDGARWSIVPSINPQTEADDYLRRVKCAASNDCWAVGYTGDGLTLVEHWDGNSWAVSASPSPGGQRNRLYAVTCTSESNCWAVGLTHDDALGSHDQTLVEHWDGSAWSVVSSANSNTSPVSVLTAISCTNTDDCMAAGYQGANGATQPLFEHWDGSAWMIVSAANPSGAQYVNLHDLTCYAATDCTAVGESSAGVYDPNTGDYIYQILIEHWNGTSWSIVPAPNSGPNESNYLLGVTCTSSSQCWAVGYAQSLGFEQPVIEQWNGVAWTMTTASTNGTNFNLLYAVTCSGTAHCFAVGNHEQNTRGLEWDGNSWSVVPSDSAEGGGLLDMLQGVACPSAADCWAVGAGGGPPFIQHWNGNSWTIFPSDNNLLYYQYLSGVTCASQSSCWAVGWYNDGIHDQALILGWDGQTWTQAASPTGSDGAGTFLNAIICNSTTDCWAVGSSSTTTSSSTLIQHWNGVAWSVVVSPNASNAPINYLSAVTCLSSADCWAVGSSADSNDSNNQTLIEHWNGSAWSAVTSTNPGATNVLNGVSCTSASDCWAVGFQITDQQGGAIIEHWNGNVWSNVASPPADEFDGITCVSSGNCWAVGTASSYVDTTMIAYWDGNTWSKVSSPNFDSAHGNRLANIFCSSTVRCFAVGYHEVDDLSQTSSVPIRQTLIEQFTASIQITTATRDANGFHLSGEAVPNTAVELQVSANLLSEFSPLKMTNSGSDGSFQFTDADAQTPGQKFYRVSYP